MQTAEEIGTGFSKEFTIQTSHFLGEPGPFVFNSEKAKQEFITHGNYGVVRKMQNSIPVKGARSKESGSSILIKFIEDSLSQISENEFVIFISHDAIITLVINYLFSELFEESHWLNFLDGLGIKKLPNSLVFFRNKKAYEYK